jgi:hypothetical protein
MIPYAAAHKGFLLPYRPVRNGPYDLWIKSSAASQLFGVHLVALTIARDSRTFATMTSCASCWSCSLIQIECVPASMAARVGGKSVNHFSTSFGWL